MGFYSSDLAQRHTIEPYIVSILALNEVENNRHLDEVGQFIQWYFSKLNYPDHYGLTGTIYLHSLQEGRERTIPKYDSVDGYAGLFLHLLQQYVVKTGDIGIVHTNWNKIEDIAYLLPVLQDSDGLTRALPDSRVKYLMDNCEAYGGVSAYLAMANLTGKGNIAYYSKVREAIKYGIIAHLYDSENRVFAWAVEGPYQSKSSWWISYPDAYAQLFPIYYDILIDEPDAKNHLWWQFTGKYAGLVQTFPIEQQIIYNLTRRKMERAVEK